MWRQSRLLDLKLWQTACQGAKQSSEHVLAFSIRNKHSAGKQKVLQLERELSRLKATSLEQLQDQVRQKVTVCNTSGRKFHHGMTKSLRLLQQTSFMYVAGHG